MSEVCPIPNCELHSKTYPTLATPSHPRSADVYQAFIEADYSDAELEFARRWQEYIDVRAEDEDFKPEPWPRIDG